MIVSLSLLNSAMEKYRAYSRKRKKERYSPLLNVGSGISSGIVVGFYSLAILFVLLELLVMIFAVKIAIKCAHKGPERIIHLVLAVVFTFPYILLSMFFNECAINVVRGMDIPIIGKKKIDKHFVPESEYVSMNP